jgi:hypothetical protein
VILILVASSFRYVPIFACCRHQNRIVSVFQFFAYRSPEKLFPFPLPSKFLLRWLYVASVWSAPGFSLVMPLPPSLGPMLTDQVCFRELGAGLIQSPVNLWLPVSAAKAESPPLQLHISSFLPASINARSASGTSFAARLLVFTGRSDSCP